MPVETHQFEIATRGHSEVLDLNSHLENCLKSGRIRNGLVNVFVTGSTAAITTTEFEPGLVTRDLKSAMEKIAPEDGVYLHEQTWHDDNGHSHVRASLIGPSLTIPLIDGKLVLGTWQQVVLIDYDTRPRRRTITVQILGE